jgi:hypothetical protein
LYRAVLFLQRYMEFYDNAAPPLAGYAASDPFAFSSAAEQKPWHTTLAGLYEDYKPGGVDFFNDQLMVVCHAPTGPQVAAGAPSLLVFYDRATAQVAKIMTLLHTPNATAFNGTCGGVAVAGAYVYVTDDTPGPAPIMAGGVRRLAHRGAAWPAPDITADDATGGGNGADAQVKAGTLLAFSKADINAALADAYAGPANLTVASLNGFLLEWDLPISASHVFYDNDPVSPRLWVSEYYEPKDGDKPEVKVLSGTTGLAVGFQCTPNVGLFAGAQATATLRGETLNLPYIIGDTQFEIGPLARAFTYGYVEFVGAPVSVWVNRCTLKRGYDCRVEFHEMPK